MKEIEIAPKFSINDWKKLSKKITQDIDNRKLWDKALSVFYNRINSRYIEPAKIIQNSSLIQGEGFSIVAILCSLIEALESFYQGKHYRRATKLKPLDKDIEYYKSQPLFESFLKNRKPFCDIFTSNELITDFYENVRCAILHEAATRNSWIIRIDNSELISIKGNVKILNRVLFLNSIEQYIEFYKKELLHKIELKKAFIRKMNAICNTA